MSGAGALATADAVASDIVILDLGLPDIDGMDVIERIRARQPDTSIIVLSARTGSKDKVAALDLDARTVTRPGAAGEDRIRLTPTEWRMLDVLVRNPGRLVTGPELLTAMRGGADNTEASYLRIYMQQLRRKLEAEPSRPRHLLTEPGMGYRFQP